MNKKSVKKDLVNKTRVSLSLENGLSDYLVQVSKDTGYTRTAIVEELLKMYLYDISEEYDSPIIRALDYRKEQLGN
jgi:predicted DNA-binding protein